ncbi:Fic family protein [Streptomyces sp. ISL-11]|uniref:Fic family protein n=1 Tax=Streptomyces sp. ISL-11 TaxID=2819174 RepID=UPI0027E58D08|nr:Fic family protein [Streptomyces sp. ISL-11]
MTGDALAVWCHVRQQVDWVSAVTATPAPVQPAVDGLTAWFDGPIRRRDPERADRLLAATAVTRAAAARKERLTPAMLDDWQRVVLDVPRAHVRQGDAFAKGGRERYGLTPRTWYDFAACLRQSDDPAVPLASRAARAYLDIAFFHPYPDGNARLALLALAHVLELEDVRLDQVGPLQIARYADDPVGAADLAVLVAVLIRAAHRRAAASPALTEPPVSAPGSQG